LYADFAPRHFALDGATQITSDGSQKTGLVTNGTNLYFGEMREGRIVLSTVPVSGGPVREIPTPFIRAEPQDISRDGTRLLVLAGEGGEHERSLWTLPLHGGKPSRVGDLLCHSAAWSPDDRHIAFGYGNAVYLTTGNGATPRLLHTFTGVPLLLRWSLDGRRIFVQLRDSATWNAFLWELTLDGTDDSRVSSLAPASFTLREYDAVSNVLNRNDDLLVSSGKTIWIMQKKRMPWQSGFNLTELSTEMSGYGALAVDVNARRLYVTKETPAKNELDWFDGKSHQFRPFLPGISARDVDFSRDGERIAYVRERENTLWIGDAHGAAAQQIATPGMLDIELPRWSPDGKQIAFMGKLADSPYRIFVANKVTGRPREASRGSDNQGAPTWSPDGRHLVYGEVWCQETKTCAIEQIDLATGQQTRVPGSEGLSTARWSPDGRFIAALRTDLHEVWLQDCRTRIWRKLADANGDNLAWAPDSKAIYASNPNGDRPEVIRISLKDGKVEPAVDLSDFSKLSGRIDTWFSVTPDNSILFLHIFSAHEIYSWRYFEN
jgi:Tol biopolymer transport system component